MPVPRRRCGLSGSALRPVKAFAARYNISEAMVRKGRGRETAHDRSHARHPLPSSLDVTQEASVVGLRRDVGLSLKEALNKCIGSVFGELSRTAEFTERSGLLSAACSRPACGRQARLYL